MVSIIEAASAARIEFLGKAGVVGVSYDNDRIIVYVESEEYSESIPTTYYGYPVEIRISGQMKTF